MSGDTVPSAAASNGIAMTLGTVLLLYPVATVLHVAEEWPRFPRWARRFASPAYSDREYLVTHAATVVLATASAALLCAYPAPSLLLAFVAFVFGPAVAWNGLFHVGASLVTRRYCAGAITGALLYLPLAAAFATAVVRDGFVGGPALVAGFGAALAVHVAEVGHTVFKRW